MQEILEVLQDTAIDTIKLLPFLFITYLIMEYIEHKTSDKTKKIVEKSGKYGIALTTGEEKVEPQYESLNNIYQNYYIIELNW